jgi:stearoyl-CoA desaturase (delta-9 desaturase)
MSRTNQVVNLLAVLIPPTAFLLTVVFFWNDLVGPTDLIVMAIMYVLTGFGITVGFHRYLTHGSFRANRPLRIALAVMGSMAVEGPAIQWVADHRKHHQYSDQADDPHSPWRYGDTPRALLKGMYHAHLGWLFEQEQTSQAKYAPDLLKDRDIVWVSRNFGLLVVVSALLPAVIGGLWSWSWQGAVSAFFWATLVRIALLHHVTWSINSVCHVVGQRPFRSRDKSGNVWWLAVASFGESWHNLHHAEPTSARHGALRGQVDSSARLIWLFEKAGWASHVRWPDAERLAARRAA